MSCWLSETCKKYNKDSCDNDCEFCIKRWKLNNLYAVSNLDYSQRKKIPLLIDSDNSDLEAFNYLKSFQDNIEENVRSGKNLYIWSEITGNGKTEWSIRLLQEYFNAIWHKCTVECHGLFLNVPKYLLSIKDAISNYNEYAEHAKSNILNADLLVLDEIGSKVGTEFELENLLSSISHRISNKKSTIYTSNLSPDKLREKVGDRLYSRIINTSTVLEFKGNDKRRLVLNDSTSSIKQNN